VLVSVLRDFLRRFGGKNAARSRHQRGMTRSRTDLSDAEWLIDDERVDVSAWRLRRLLESNFAPPLAMRLANTPGVDVHALLDLVARGCSPELAAKILDPFVDTSSDAAT
jgi:hypothetical protein